MNATKSHYRRDLTRVGIVLAVIVAMVVSLASVDLARAQQAPIGVSVEQDYGLATVSWDEVPGASQYHIERTPLEGDEAVGDGEVVGIWSPDRGGDFEPGPLTFADSGFVLGERYQWRVRAVVDGSEGDWSDPVADDTQGVVGPEEFHTGFELSDGADWTTHEDEVEVLEAIADASDRVRLETIAETYEGRPLHVATVGHPAPKTPEEIAESPSVLIAANVHGVERSGREASLSLLRRLAFSDDAWTMGILEGATVLITPSTNPDGQVRGMRTNLADQDLNRDHLMLRHPENFGLSQVIRDHQPDIIVDPHELGGRGGDVEYLWPRALIVNEELFDLNQHHYARGHIYDAAVATGWSPIQWGTHREDNWETLLSNVAGLKNSLGLLQETPRRVPPSRPAEVEEDTAANKQRRVYTALWGLRETLDYHQENLPAIQSARAASVEGHSANEGPVPLDGAYDIPVHPPPNEAPSIVLDPPPCGYRLSAEQYATQDSGELIDTLDGQQWTSHTVEDRLEAHGVEVEELGSGIVQVPLAQPLRGVIPFLFDPELDTENRPIGTPNISMVEATRLDDRRDSVIIGGVDTGVPNRVDDVSCSINDLIADEQDWPNRGQFMRHVNTVVKELRADGQVSGREGGAITSAAARSDVGR